MRLVFMVTLSSLALCVARPLNPDVLSSYASSKEEAGVIRNPHDAVRLPTEGVRMQNGAVWLPTDTERRPTHKFSDASDGYDDSEEEVVGKTKRTPSEFVRRPVDHGRIPSDELVIPLRKHPHQPTHHHGYAGSEEEVTRKNKHTTSEFVTLPVHNDRNPTGAPGIPLHKHPHEHHGYVGSEEDTQVLKNKIIQADAGRLLTDAVMMLKDIATLQSDNSGTQSHHIRIPNPKYHDALTEHSDSEEEVQVLKHNKIPTDYVRNPFDNIRIPTIYDRRPTDNRREPSDDVQPSNDYVQRPSHGHRTTNGNMQRPTDYARRQNSSHKPPSDSDNTQDNDFIIPKRPGIFRLRGDRSTIMRELERRTRHRGNSFAKHKLDTDGGDGTVLSQNGSPDGPIGAVTKSGHYSYTGEDGTTVDLSFVADEIIVLTSLGSFNWG